MTTFTQTFGGSAVSPADVAYAAYTFGTNLQLYWPQFSEGQTNVAARFMSLTANAVSLNVFMPDATLNSVGYDAIVFNAGSDTFNVVDSTGGAIATIAPGQTYYLMLTSNVTQAGTWLTIQFGVGTGSANAAALAGFGLLAMAGLLEVNFVVNGASNDFPITSAGRGQLYNWTGGSGTITLPAASSVGNGFFFMLANNGSGSITVDAGSGTIDQLSTSVFSQTQSGFIISDGSNWETVGKGLQNTFAVTLLNLNVAGGSDVTETSAQAQNIIQQLTGLLTANINVIVPATVQLYFVSNQTSGAHTVTFKASGGSGVLVPQGSNAILYCDGTNIVNAFTAAVSGTLALTSGSAISPSLFFQSFPGTGIYSPGANLFSITSNTTEVIRFSAQTSAVNYFGVVASSTGSALAFGAVGTDTNINIDIVPKGSGYVALGFLDATIIGANIPGAITGTTVTASIQFNGPGTGLTGTAASLSIGGSAASLSATLPVSEGGTGDVSLTSHGVVIGQGTSPVSVTAAGSAGQVLTSNGPGNDPTFQNTLLLSSVYPVGSLYLSTVSTNPNTLFGFGTWAAFAAGQVLLGVGSFTDGDGISKTIAGGQQLGEYLHSLTTPELASHTHTANVTDPGHTHNATINDFAGGGASDGLYGAANSTPIIATNPANLAVLSATTGITVANTNTGSGTGHNNIQPSIGVYIWQRTV